MSAVAYMKQSIDFLHRSYRQGGEGLTADQLHFVPEGESHSIAWIIWHGMRVEDLFVQQLFKGGKQEWEAGGWAERTGLPERSFGTGQSTEEARAIRIIDPDAFTGYVNRVAELTEEYLSSITDADLERQIKVGQREESVGQAITLHLVTHLNGHRGEINLLRGMLGLGPVLVNQGG